MYKHGAVAPKRTEVPIISTINKQSFTKISVQVLLQWNDFNLLTNLNESSTECKFA